MNINLGSLWEAFIDENVKSGRYVSASEVVRDGLRLLQEKEQIRLLHMERLRAEIDVGVNALDRGDYREFDAEGMKSYLEELNTRGHKRIGRKKAGE